MLRGNLAKPIIVERMAAIVLLVVGALGGCTAVPRDVSALREQIRKLESEKAALQRQVAAGQQPTQVKRLRLQTYMDFNSGFVRTYAPYAGDVIKQLTGGAIEIKIFSDSALVPDGQLFDAVSKGTIHLAHTSQGRDAGKIGPVGDIVLGMPFMWKSMEEADTLYYDLGIGDIIRPLYAKFNIHAIGPANGTGNNFGFWTTKPIRTLADFGRMKLRISGGRPAGDLFTGFGATSVAMGMGDIYTSLSTGMIDGASASSVSTNMGRGFAEVAKYIIEPAYVRNYSTLMIANADVWKSFTDQQKKIIEIAFRNWFVRASEIVQLEDDKALATLKAKGIQVIRLPDADAAKLVKTAEDGWAKAAGNDATAQKALGIIKDYLRSKGYL